MINRKVIELTKDQLGGKRDCWIKRKNLIDGGSDNKIAKKARKACHKKKT